MENKEQSQNVNEQATLSKQDEKAARKARMRERRLARRAKRNARIARGRLFKNIVIWLFGVLFLPLALVGVSFVVPISVITGSNGEYVSEDLSKRSVFEVTKYVATNSGELGFSDLPIIAKTFTDLQDTEIGEKEGGEKITVGDLIFIDTDQLNTIKFGDGDIAGKIQSCIEIVATIESIGGASALGDFGNLSVFTEEDIAGTVAEINAQDESADTRKQYYYKPSEISASSFSAGDATYKRAFKDEGTLVDELSALSDTDKGVIRLYYPPLEKIKLSELKDIIGDSIGRTTISSLLDTLGGSNDTITDILGADTTIAGLKDFDVNGVKLNVVLEEKSEGDEGYEENAKLWSVLKDAIGELPDGRTDITIGDLANGFDLDKVPLNTVIKEITDDTDPEYDNNHKFWTILKQAVVLEDGETIDDEHPVTVGHLSKGFDIENVKLTDVIAVNDTDAKNSKLWTILEQTVTDDDGNPLTRDEITLHDLNYHFTVDNIALTSVLDAPTADNGYKNKQIYDILLDATMPDDPDEAAAYNYDSIRLNSLSSFTANNIHLNTVLENVDLSSNKVLTALKEKNTTVANIGTALNELSLYEVYGNSAFVEITVDNPAPTGARRFNKGTYHDTVNNVDKVCFDYDTDGDYYLDNTAGIWLILCYDTVTYNPDESVNTRFADSDGNPTKYIADELTVGDLQNGNSFSKKFQNATLKQLLDTGLVDGNALGGGSLSQKTKALSLQEIIALLASSDVQDIINNS